MDASKIEQAADYKVFDRSLDQTVHIREIADKEWMTMEAALPLDVLATLRDSHALQEAKDAAVAVSMEEAAVATILVDNSGSMRGDRIVAAAAATTLLARELEAAGVPTEILGYTTRWWKGGEARQRWLAAGKPANPGRISERRHIIYRGNEAGEFGGEDEIAICSMAAHSLLKENLDNEAIAWAAERLLSRNAATHYLLLITDGVQPICDSTMALGQEKMLGVHHQAVVDALEEEPTLRFGTVLIKDHYSVDHSKSPYRRLMVADEAGSRRPHGRAAAIVSAAAAMLSDLTPSNGHRPWLVAAIPGQRMKVQHHP